ncbi:MAG: hypothetical protein M1826_007541 [Phylliscum demangeonii]|nr:MAG: hypothetical protein M1826_007541 [Phylliscum demangeonii]
MVSQPTTPTAAAAAAANPASKRARSASPAGQGPPTKRSKLDPREETATAAVEARSASPAGQGPPTQRSKLDQREEKAKAALEAQIAALEEAAARKLLDKKGQADNRLRTWTRGAVRKITDLKAKLADTEEKVEKRTRETEEKKTELEVESAKRVAISTVAMQTSFANDMKAMRAAALLL